MHRCIDYLEVSAEQVPHVHPWILHKISFGMGSWISVAVIVAAAAASAMLVVAFLMSLAASDSLRNLSFDWR